MSKLSKSGEKLYNACFKSAKDSDPNLNKQFQQADLQGLVQCDINELLQLIQELVAHNLFRSYKSNGAMSWGVRTRDLAININSLSEHERIVFSQVEDVGSTGVWSKRIKSATHIPPTDVQKALNKLERQGMIKGIKSVKSPAQRTYMLSHLVPSDEITGGSFFDAGELDLSMVTELCNLIIFRVRALSWHDTKRKIKRETVELDGKKDGNVDSGKAKQADDAEAGADQPRKRKRGDDNDTDQPQKKRLSNGTDVDESSEQNQDEPRKRKRDGDDDADHTPKKRREEHADDDHGLTNGSTNGNHATTKIRDIEDLTLPQQKYKDEPLALQLAYPVGTKQYPTADSILEWILTSKAIREDKAHSLSIEELQGVLDVLVWDDKLEKIGSGYRTVRGVEHKELADDDPFEDITQNGLTEVPCSRCELFNLCKPGTKVNANSCSYYNKWLKPGV